IHKFLNQMRIVYRNHLQFKCLLLSSVQMFSKYPGMAARYKKTQIERKATLYQGMLKLKKRGYLKSSFSEKEMKELIDTLSIIARFWIADAIHKQGEKTEEQVVGHYLR